VALALIFSFCKDSVIWAFTIEMSETACIGGCIVRAFICFVTSVLIFNSVDCELGQYWLPNAGIKLGFDDSKAEELKLFVKGVLHALIDVLNGLLGNIPQVEDINWSNSEFKFMVELLLA